MDRRVIEEAALDMRVSLINIDKIVDLVMQLLTTARQETYKEILQDGLYDTRTHPEWIAFLERGAGKTGGDHEQKA